MEVQITKHLQEDLEDLVVVVMVQDGKMEQRLKHQMEQMVQIILEAAVVAV